MWVNVAGAEVGVASGCVPVFECAPEGPFDVATSVDFNLIRSASFCEAAHFCLDVEESEVTRP